MSAMHAAGRAGLTGAMALGLMGSASAQVLPPPAPELEAVAWLEGEWSGTGWMQYSPDRRGEFEGTERVEWRMGERVLVVEGEFTARMGPDAGPVVVHQAVGVLSYDVRGDRYLFRTYTARGGHGEAHEAEVSDGRIVWGYDDPTRGKTRYTITRTAEGAWHEVGHVSPDDGETWHQFFEMALRRVGG